METSACIKQVPTNNDQQVESEYPGLFPSDTSDSESDWEKVKIDDDGLRVLCRWGRLWDYSGSDSDSDISTESSYDTDDGISPRTVRSNTGKRNINVVIDLTQESEEESCSPVGSPVRKRPRASSPPPPICSLQSIKVPTLEQPSQFTF